MSFRKASLAAMLAVSMASTPALAQSASSISVAPTTRAAATTEDANELRGGWFVPLAAVVAIILGLLVLLNDDGDDRPTSP